MESLLVHRKMKPFLIGHRFKTRLYEEKNYIYDRPINKFLKRKKIERAGIKRAIKVNREPISKKIKAKLMNVEMKNEITLGKDE